MDYLKQFAALVNGIKLTTLFTLIGLDFLLGVLLAIIGKTFKWDKVASYLDTDVLRLVAGYYLVGIFALLEPTIGGPALLATWLTIDAKLLSDIVAKFQKLGVILKGGTP